MSQSRQELLMILEIISDIYYEKININIEYLFKFNKIISSNHVHYRLGIMEDLIFQLKYYILLEEIIFIFKGQVLPRSSLSKFFQCVLT